MNFSSTLSFLTHGPVISIVLGFCIAFLFVGNLVDEEWKRSHVAFTVSLFATIAIWVTMTHYYHYRTTQTADHYLWTLGVLTLVSTFSLIRYAWFCLRTPHPDSNQEISLVYNPKKKNESMAV